MPDTTVSQYLAELGAEVRKARTAAGLSQTDVSARAGISRDTLSRMERGAPVDTRSLCAVATALGLRVELHRVQLRAADMRRKYAHLHEDAE
jgi:transcriptional regulator with XRE-family HTH domain